MRRTLREVDKLPKFVSFHAIAPAPLVEPDVGTSPARHGGEALGI